MRKLENQKKNRLETERSRKKSGNTVYCSAVPLFCTLRVVGATKGAVKYFVHGERLLMSENNCLGNVEPEFGTYS